MRGKHEGRLPIIGGPTRPSADAAIKVDETTVSYNNNVSLSISVARA